MGGGGAPRKGGQTNLRRRGSTHEEIFKKLPDTEGLQGEKRESLNTDF